MRHLIAVALAVMLAMATPAWADFNDGLAAYKRGDYGMALREWWPLAEQGNEKVQAVLGFLYYKGQGVSQECVKAAMWLRLRGRRDACPARPGAGIAAQSIGGMKVVAGP